jgi:hypothetical protein
LNFKLGTWAQSRREGAIETDLNISSKKKMSDQFETDCGVGDPCDAEYIMDDIGVSNLSFEDPEETNWAKN